MRVPITVARGTLSRILHDPGDFLIQVQAVDTAAATWALELARHDIGHLDGGWRSAPGLTPVDRNSPKFVSNVFPGGTGPFIIVDGGSTPDRLLRTIPDVVARRLEEAGITDAVIISPRKAGGPIDPHLPRFVVLRLYPPAPPVQKFQHANAEIPAAWLDVAGEWLSDGLGEGENLCAATGSFSIQFPMARDAGTDFLTTCQAARTVGSTYLAAGDPTTRMRVCVGSFANTGISSLLLADGGPAATDEELIGLIETFSGVVRGLAQETGYAFVQVVPILDGCLIGPHTAAVRAGRYRQWKEGPYMNSEYPNPDWIERMCDELVLAAFPFQVLGPGHLARLGGPPPGARPLGNGKVELSIGDPQDWLLEPNDPPIPLGEPTHRVRNPRTLEVGKAILAPCMLSATEVRALLEKKRAANIGQPPRGFEYLLHKEDRS